MKVIRWTGPLLLLVSLFGCDRAPKLVQAEALAGSLPAVQPATVPVTKPLNSPATPQIKPTEAEQTWALYRTIYCAEKTGDPFFVDETLSAAGENRTTWSQRLDRLAENIRDGEKNMGQTWIRISETPCP